MDSFEVENFRSLKHLKLEKLARVNLLVGKNNVGKTSVLEAMYIMMAVDYNSWFKDVVQDRGQQIRFADFRQFFYKFDSDSVISLNSTYIDKESVEQEIFNLSLSLKEKTLSDFERDVSQISRRQNAKQDDPSSTLFVKLWIKEGNAPLYFSMNIEGSSSVLTYNGLQSAEEFIEDGWNSPASSRRYTIGLPTSVGKVDLSGELENLIVSKQIQKVVELVQKIDERIKAIQLVSGKQVYVDFGEDFSVLSPLEVVGEGVQKFLSIAIAILNTKGGTVLIDEIDNGLHYSALRALWKGVLQVAREHDVQIFATTHSAEALRHLTWVLDDDCKDYRDDIAAYTLIRAKDDTIRSFRYDYEQLDFAMEHDMEVRN